MKQKLIYALIILGIVGFFWIMGASAHQNCSQNIPIWKSHGLCLLRGLTEISCLLGFEVAIGVAGGFQAKARNYPFIMGFLLGFFLSFMGAIFVMTLSPRQPKNKSF